MENLGSEIVSITLKSAKDEGPLEYISRQRLQYLEKMERAARRLIIKRSDAEKAYEDLLDAWKER